MSDRPSDRVTIRHPVTQREREIARSAIPFWRDWEVLTSDGRVNPNPAPAKKEND